MNNGELGQSKIKHNMAIKLSRTKKHSLPYYSFQAFSVNDFRSRYHIIYLKNYFSKNSTLFSLPFQISASGSGALTSVNIGHCLDNSAFN